MQKIIILFGKPGVGKSSRLELYGNNPKVQIIQPGNSFRNEIEEETELGLKLKPILEKGKLISDEFVNQFIQNKLKDRNGTIILDGYPRSLSQAEWMLQNDIIPQKIIHLQADSPILWKRLLDRVCCPKCQKTYTATLPLKLPKKAGFCDDCNTALIKRDDDTPASIRNRLLEYERKTAPILELFASKGIEIITLDGNTTNVDLIKEHFRRAIEE